MTTQSAIKRWEKNQDFPYAGRVESNTSGNGGVMRLAPVVIWNRLVYEDALVDAVRQSMLTHASEFCVRYAQALAAILWTGSTTTNYVSHSRMCEVPPDESWPHAGGDVMSATRAAVWAVDTTSNFEEALIKAVNLGGDSDTVGAITGQIAGRIYGVTAIPDRWLKKLKLREDIRSLAISLFNQSR